MNNPRLSLTLEDFEHQVPEKSKIASDLEVAFIKDMSLFDNPRKYKIAELSQLMLDLNESAEKLESLGKDALAEAITNVMASVGTKI